MQIQGSHTFSAPRQAVWDALLDPTVLSMALPGGEQLEKVNENEYKATMSVKVGPVQGKFEGKVELSNINHLTSYTMKVSGSGAPGFLNGSGDVTLQDAPNGTLMSYVGDAQVGGKIAGVGQRLIESTAKSIIKQGLAALDGQIQARVAVQPVVAQSVAAQAESVAQSVSSSVESAAAATQSTVQTAATTTASATTTQATSAAASVAASTIAGATTVPTAASQVALPPRPAGPSAMQIGLEVAKDVGRDILSDVIPLKSQEKALWFTVGALAMLIFVILVKLVA